MAMAATKDYFHYQLFDSLFLNYLINRRQSTKWCIQIGFFFERCSIYRTEIKAANSHIWKTGKICLAFFN